MYPCTRVIKSGPASAARSASRAARCVVGADAVDCCTRLETRITTEDDAQGLYENTERSWTNKNTISDNVFFVVWGQFLYIRIRQSNKVLVDERPTQAFYAAEKKLVKLKCF